MSWAGNASKPTALRNVSEGRSVGGEVDRGFLSPPSGLLLRLLLRGGKKERGGGGGRERERASERARKVQGDIDKISDFITVHGGGERDGERWRAALGGGDKHRAKRRCISAGGEWFSEGEGRRKWGRERERRIARIESQVSPRERERERDGDRTGGGGGRRLSF